jgi:hypothetical protein
VHPGLLARQIVISRLGAPFGHELVTAALADGDRDLGVWIVHIAEQAGVGRTGQHTGRLAIALGELGIGDAVDAERAFLHDPLLGIELARPVGTGPGAVFAADALVIVDQHHAVVRALVGGAGRTHGHTGGLFAVQTALGEVHRLGMGEVADLEGLDPIEKGAGR